jgi:hypothetical protein
MYVKENQHVEGLIVFGVQLFSGRLGKHPAWVSGYYYVRNFKRDSIMNCPKFKGLITK